MTSTLTEEIAKKLLEAISKTPAFNLLISEMVQDLTLYGEVSEERFNYLMKELFLKEQFKQKETVTE